MTTRSITTFSRRTSVTRSYVHTGEAAWLHTSLNKMCNAYDKVVDTNEVAYLFLHKWCVARLTDSRDSGEVDFDLSDEVIKREAEKLELEIHKLASSFVDNEFDEKE